MCPLILAFRKHKIGTHVCITGQHKQMLDQILEVFEIAPHVDLALMEPDQSLASFTSRAVTALDCYLSRYQPSLVIIQGDTTTTFVASLVSYYHRIPVGHVEAGLRTWDKYSPFPEEINRVLTTKLSDYHFAPTSRAKENLLKEGVSGERVYLTGNTVIDALHMTARKVRKSPADIPSLPRQLVERDFNKPIVLITGHRRESFGQGFENICRAISRLAADFPETQFVYPVHLNPNVREPVFRFLNGSDNIHLIEPLNYLQFVFLMERSTLILTDSGGVQEEAPGLGKPVLVMRDTTERPEGVSAGTAKLVGTDQDCIVQNVAKLLTDSDAYAEMSKANNPYGDGTACEQIVCICRDILNGGN